jgi:hypothetical protein
LEEQGPTSNGPMPATEAICPSTSRSDYADMAPPWKAPFEGEKCIDAA